MRILLAHAFYRLAGGEDRYVMHQKDLLEARHEVRLWGEGNEELTPGFGTAMSMIRSDRVTRRAQNIMREFRPEIIHLHNAYPAFGPAVHLAAAELGIPLVMTVHNYRLRCPNGLMFTEGTICRRCERGTYVSAVLHQCFPDRKQSAAYAAALWFHRFVLHLQDKVSMFIGPSRFVQDRLIQWGIPAERTRAIPNPVEAVDAPSDPGSFGVFVGRLSAEKGVEVLLRALSRAGDPPFKIVGDGPVRRGAEQLAWDLGLHRTEFLGVMDAAAVYEVLEASRYLVMPSIWEETGGISALEAMAHGRPIIVSALGSLIELADGGAGLAAVPGDVDDLVTKIRQLSVDDDLCLNAGKQAWNLCRNEHSGVMHVSRLEEAYASVLASAPRRQLPSDGVPRGTH
jgi:glycosyltransferase involved in cell wall biosynthesis